MTNQMIKRSERTKSMLLTNGDVLTRYHVDTTSIEHLDEAVPILTGPQAQGDVLILPADARDTPGNPIPAAGLPVVRGETTGGNSHILHALEGECRWTPSPNADTELTQGWVTVAEGGSAVLIHTQEHGVLGVGEGCYEVRRQREFAGEWRRVSD